MTHVAPRIANDVSYVTRIKNVVFRGGTILVMADSCNGECSGGTRYFLIPFGMKSAVIPAVMLTSRSPVVAHL